MSLPELPNPSTPLAWLPPDTAFQFEVSRYIAAATVGAWLWDILMSIGDEVLIFRKQIKRPDAIYMLARIGTGCFVMTSFVFDVAPVADCEALVRAIGWTGALSLPLNTLLFLFRVYAIFEGHRMIFIIFSFLWVSTAAASLTAPFSLSGIHIGTTSYCIFDRVKPYGSAGIVTSAVNDTLVFIAITFMLLMHAPGVRASERLKTFVSGKGMGTMSRAVMQGGQQYYLATVGFNIVAAVCILVPSVPAAYGNILSVPNGALQNAMASRVYRQLKLGYIKDNATPTPTSLTLKFNTSMLNAGTTTSRSNHVDEEVSVAPGIDHLVNRSLTSPIAPQYVANGRQKPGCFV